MDLDYSVQFAATSVAEASYVKRKRTVESNEPRRLSVRRRGTRVNIAAAFPRWRALYRVKTAEVRQSHMRSTRQISTHLALSE